MEVVTIPKQKIKACKYCGKVSDDLSVRNICADCGSDRMKENIKQIREKKGPMYDKWRINLIMSTLGDEE